MANFITELVVALYQEPCLRPRPRKNCDASANFHTKTMTSAFTSACKDKGLTSEMDKEAAELQSAYPYPGTFGYKGIVIHIVNRRLEISLLGLLLHLVLSSNHFGLMKIKGSLEVLCRSSLV